ncbi:hypothetical protein BVX94_01595, partial [bacterium B17]
MLSGTLSGNIDTTTPNPNNGDGNAVTNLGPWRATQNSGWGGDTTYVYTGEIYFDGTDYFFIESIDDKSWLKIDGVVYINDSTWDNVANSGLISKPEGWYPFELRMSNGGGGAGYVNRNPGFQYHSGGGTSDAEGDNDYPLDPGDASLFRHDNENATLSLSIDNNSASDITGTGAKCNATIESDRTVFDVYLYWGQTDEGTNAAAWANTNFVGSVTNMTSANVSHTLSTLSAGTDYYYTFMATNVSTNIWATPSTTFKTLTAPTVNNGTGASITGSGSVTLTGNLTGGSQANIYIYWGTTDGGTTASAWENTNSLGLLPEGVFSTNITSGVYFGPNYYYRCFAQSAAGSDWADSTETFVTEENILRKYPTDGLLGLWSFDDGTPDDISGNDYHGTNYGSVVYTSDTPNGNGQAIDLNGGDNAVFVSTGGNEEVFYVDSISISLWFKEMPDGHYYPFVSKLDGWRLQRRATDNRFRWDIINGDEAGTTSHNFETEWHHIVVTYESGVEKRLYIDSKLEQSWSRTGTVPDSTRKLVFGAWDNG